MNISIQIIMNSSSSSSSSSSSRYLLLLLLIILLLQLLQNNEVSHFTRTNCNYEYRYNNHVLVVNAFVVVHNIIPHHSSGRRRRRHISNLPLSVTTTTTTTRTTTTLNTWSEIQKRYPYRSMMLSLFRKRRYEEEQHQPQFMGNNHHHQNNNNVLVQVVSDVDDTLKSSGGVKILDIALGGIDTQYTRNTIYPGVAEFMLQLSLGPYNNNNNYDNECRNQHIKYNRYSRTTNYRYVNQQQQQQQQQQQRPVISKIAILTARAYELKVFLEMKDTNPLSMLFRSTATKYNITNDWGFDPVLYGSIAEWIVQDRKGLRKFHNFEQLLRLQQQPPPPQQYQPNTTTTTTSPTEPDVIMNYIYVGDTGEYDEEAAMAMLQYYPQHVQAIFLHVVTDDPFTIQSNTVPIPSTKYMNGRPMIYFRTYIGAALSAFQYGFIHRDGLQCIVDAVSSSLTTTTTTTTKFTTNQLYDLQYDLDRANELLQSTIGL